MDTQLFERSAAPFRSLLVGLRADQLDNPTPCRPLTVARLVDKSIGHMDWVRGALHGLQAAPDYSIIDPADYINAFDRSAAMMVAELQTEGAATRKVMLAAGLSFSGFDVMILASRNVFIYAWDLAKAIGQSTDLDPDVATELLALSKTRVVPQRGPGGFFGPEVVPPDGASAADRLASFLGRSF